MNGLLEIRIHLGEIRTIYKWYAFLGGNPTKTCGEPYVVASLLNGSEPASMLSQVLAQRSDARAVYRRIKTAAPRKESLRSTNAEPTLPPILYLRSAEYVREEIFCLQGQPMSFAAKCNDLCKTIVKRFGRNVIDFRDRQSVQMSDLKMLDYVAIMSTCGHGSRLCSHEVRVYPTPVTRIARRHAEKIMANQQSIMRCVAHGRSAY